MWRTKDLRASTEIAFPSGSSFLHLVIGAKRHPFIGPQIPVAFPDLADLETRHDVLVARLNRELALIEQARSARRDDSQLCDRFEALLCGLDCFNCEIEVFHGQIRCRKRAGGLAVGAAADSAVSRKQDQDGTSAYPSHE